MCGKHQTLGAFGNRVCEPEPCISQLAKKSSRLGRSTWESRLKRKLDTLDGKEKVPGTRDSLERTLPCDSCIISPGRSGGLGRQLSREGRLSFSLLLVKEWAVFLILHGLQDLHGNGRRSAVWEFTPEVGSTLRQEPLANLL